MLDLSTAIILLVTLYTNSNFLANELEPMAASWYGYELAGSPMANGQPFNPNKMTAAHRTLPLGTELWVYDPVSFQSVTVIITDRGPYVDGLELDLSLAAAQELGFQNQGRHFGLWTLKEPERFFRH